MYASTKRLLLILPLFLLLIGASVAYAIETDPNVGPWLADTGRDLVGPSWVAWGEEQYYAVEDRISQWRYRDAPPASMWIPETTSIEELPVSPQDIVWVPSTPPRFRPADFAPPVPSVAAPGDGQWTVWTAGPIGSDAAVYRTEVHPDAARTQAVVAVIVMDLQQLELHLLPGTREPLSDVMAAEARTGVVPVEDRGRLVAAFNGGWQSVHGHYGMRVGSIELVPPVLWGCGIAQMTDGRLRINSWSVLADLEAQMSWFREAPPCLVEERKEDHLLDEDSRRWGTALGGSSVVRRSAIGIDATGKLLYYAVGDSMTSIAITRALEAAGAVSAAMLDINYSYPRFVTFQPESKQIPTAYLDHLPRKPVPPEDAYLAHPATKDFFYLTRRPEPLAASSAAP